MKEDLESQLRAALTRLEASSQKIIETRGYDHDAARLRLLMEIIKEQLKNENSRPPTREIR
jgi:hypothetical protein